MDFRNGHRRRGESAAANEAGTVLPNRETVLPDQAVDGTPSHMPAQVLWALLFFSVAVIQIQISVKFHNQLHFKPYMHIHGPQ